ncbi:MAG TPA: hypothetical protein VEO74_12385, partial [Thermoanaerobaculia bacterium]|nr:hypothetical protein [Thermoanaerobaculia bacterium]
MKVDVAIAGGGPAASAAAIALRRRGLSCAIGLDLARDGHLPCHGHRSVWGSDTPVEMPFDLS